MKKLFVIFAFIIALCISSFAQKKTSPTKTKTPSNTENKSSENGGSMFFITIEHNGEKTEIADTQFETHDGSATIENEKNSRMLLFYGASNSKKNDSQFMFQGMISGAAKGSYSLGKDVTFTFNSDKFPNVPMFLCQSGGYEITAMPLKGGFVEGTFSANCTGEFRDDGSVEKYTMSGRFKLLRQS